MRSVTDCPSRSHQYQDHETLGLAVQTFHDGAPVTGKVGGAAVLMANLRPELVSRPAIYEVRPAPRRAPG